MNPRILLVFEHLAEGVLVFIVPNPECAKPKLIPSLTHETPLAFTTSVPLAAAFNSFLPFG